MKNIILSYGIICVQLDKSLDIDLNNFINFIFFRFFFGLLLIYFEKSR